MIERFNKLLELNAVMVRIGDMWYKLEEVTSNLPHSMPIFVSDDDGGDHEFDMADIEEFDNELMEPIFMLTNCNIVGLA